MDKTEDGKFFKRLGKITGTFLGIEDHGIFTAMLDMDYGETFQSVGTLCLGTEHEPSIYGSAFILHTLNACGVSKWESLKGITIYVLFKEDEFSARPVGVEALPFEGGKRFLFDELKKYDHVDKYSRKTFKGEKDVSR